MNDIGYDRRAFAVTYIEAQKNYTGGLSELSMPYNEALREHRRRLLGGLERLFGLTLSGRMPTSEGNGMVAWLLDDRRDAVFTADDLRALGVDPTPPREADYPGRDW
jgi:hypothetical protein